ncbi:MAG: alpha/beta hydrolase [Planctomycetaceae bacterium]|nr:alpha/beta hydrolase [Planctomycetaceae bacterium]
MIFPMPSNEPMLIFISGLGADERSFAGQMAVFENAVPLNWIPMRSRESLEEYAVRLADSLDPKPESCCVVGFSMGGMLAPYAAKRLNAKACILLASARSPLEFPNRYRLGGWLAQHANGLVRLFFGIGKTAIRLVRPFLKRFCTDSRYSAILQLCDCPAWRFAQALRMLTAWGYSRPAPFPVYDFPIYHLHGDKDPVLPLVPESADEVIPHCGHLVPMSHPEDTNRFIREKLNLNLITTG